MGSSTKQRVIVLGGGLGSLSAAFYLTEQPGWVERYDITIYQQGWRLGGKCASGHDMRPGYGHRIYEHGLHIFAGFYNQAFDLWSRAYRELQRPDGHPNQTVWDALRRRGNGRAPDSSDPLDPYRIWYINAEPNDERPGSKTPHPAPPNWCSDDRPARSPLPRSIQSAQGDRNVGNSRRTNRHRMHRRAAPPQINRLARHSLGAFDRLMAQVGDAGDLIKRDIGAVAAKPRCMRCSISLSGKRSRSRNSSPLPTRRFRSIDS